MRELLLVLPVCAVFLMPAVAAADYDFCFDPAGNMIQAFPDTSVPDSAIATVRNGRPVVLYNPAVLAGMTPRMQLFVFMHECGHHALGQILLASWRGRWTGSRAQEQAADCYAARRLHETGRLSLDALREIQVQLATSPGNWDHFPGPRRALNLVGCLQGEGKRTDKPKGDTPAKPKGSATPAADRSGSWTFSFERDDATFTSPKFPSREACDSARIEKQEVGLAVTECVASGSASVPGPKKDPTPVEDPEAAAKRAKEARIAECRSDCGREQQDCLGQVPSYDECIEKFIDGCMDDCEDNYGHSRSECENSFCDPDTGVNPSIWPRKCRQHARQDRQTCESDWRSCVEDCS